MEKLWLRCETITVAMEKQWKNRGTMMKKWSTVKQWKNNGKIAALLWDENDAK